VTTILVSTQEAPDVSDERDLSLQILVDDQEWAGKYDRLQVFRAELEAVGPYEELTAVTARPARLPKYGGDQPSAPVTGASAALSSKSLEFAVGTDELTVTFTGADPLTFAEAAAQVTAQGLGKILAYVDAAGLFVVETSAVGLAASLEVLGGDAAPVLALPVQAPNSRDYGEEARPQLVPGQGVYVFRDPRGSLGYFYRTRFLNAASGLYSGYSAVVPGSQASAVAAENLVYGTVRLVTPEGRPVVGRKVQVHAAFTGVVVDGYAVSGGAVVRATDAAGLATFTLLRGQRFSLSIPGTALYREFTTPTDAAVTSFDILSAAQGTTPDVFKAVVPDLVVAERRSL